ncbi:MAG: cytochrome ubiquinol oxidase subunit I [Melioribacteraceae bacterium]|nr:cytochrome ubiquinol oxidase subunit I [Melioribacteraceae bacterium]MCF8354917.1 cytochrome ubiquinol oxidase subunit I [Melioribacteraceae bacterium]MCF8395242.1 cytochrome ubiquinol oxidase subunit I [Melioribacteraceae bacterium]MCF8420712.1 cytochrome ubiquinol oxidase subunit I [Melioribacteraceae bacterium]
MDAVFLARLQFAMTVGFHFIFPPITIGLAWLLVIVETIGWRKNDERYTKIGKFFGKLLALTFVVGVASGIVMEFQFGTNWSEYSKFVGDIFGAPLAAEGVFAFFLESGFLGLYLFGRKRVSKGVHWFSGLMVAVGSTISAFWILVANSWQQTPAGFIVQNGRAELTGFWDAVFNPSTLIRFWHTFDAALITGAFFMAGVSAYLLLKKKNTEIAKISMKLALIFGLVVSVLELFPFGHEHAKQVAQTQPEKFAAIEGLYSTQQGAPLVFFALPTDNPPDLKGALEIPSVLSWLAFGDIDAEIKGLDAFPEDEIPPLWLTFVSFHNMVILGLYFILIMAIGVWYLYRKSLWEKKKLLKVFLWSIPLPVIACQLGWITAEVGRQPWIVYKLMRTSDAASVTVSAGEILFSIILFGGIYLLLGALYVYIMAREIKHGPEPLTSKEAIA